ncbi:MAG: Rrf2 family transcriptional regulator [Eisenbergiella sp.]
MHCAFYVPCQMVKLYGRRTWQREKAFLKFAYKILKKLEKAGIVQITRGASGGCRTGCDLRTATLYQLIEAVETNARLTSV